ncbi:unnamed protein product [Mytilus coruscus]|uniref:Uncharacterized protein n=1 Tax=Mytilus coruscus TaxID=42192 RepID=A0A6J8BPH2_MYTCO|nr:unnamed protein product [Mytilus coruscus]
MSNKKKSSKEGDNHSENGGRSMDFLNFQRNGLLFFALLVNNCSDEALDLLKDGYVGIHHILIGCVLLDDEINSWKKPIVMKERLQRYKSAFTERAIAITSSIYGNYKQDEQSINHAERLLLNHGYLRDAISTENNVFLKNETAKTILNEKWYGKENIDLLTMFIFGVLAVIHPLVLPFLMINLERGPLQR